MLMVMVNVVLHGVDATSLASMSALAMTVRVNGGGYVSHTLKLAADAKSCAVWDTLLTQCMSEC